MHKALINSVWPDWQINDKPIGKGSFGAVYEAHRHDFGIDSSAAIKVISIPEDEKELLSFRAEGMNDNEIQEYIKGAVYEFIREIKIMESLKGTQNIVFIEDYHIIERKSQVGWDILIKMELLTPLTDVLRDVAGIESEKEVIQLGIDICSALEYCQKSNIIHRDIKPENIFVDKFGHYKLGDFGTARTFSVLTNSLSQKGTLSYMAPEIHKGVRYDSTVDTYSLGLVLYRLRNRNKMPFMDLNKEKLTPNERVMSVKKRMDGVALPPPAAASSELSRVILKACQFVPGDRYSNPSEMKKDLISCLTKINEANTITAQPVNYSNVVIPQVTAPVVQQVPQTMPQEVVYRPVQQQQAPYNYNNYNYMMPQPTPSLPQNNVPSFNKNKQSINKALIVVLIIVILIVLLGIGISLVNNG